MILMVGVDLENYGLNADYKAMVVVEADYLSVQ